MPNENNRIEQYETHRIRNQNTELRNCSRCKAINTNEDSAIIVVNIG
jgi:hypothetical protein